MTKEEHTNKRPSFLSGWNRKNLADSSTGFSSSDIDWIYWNWKKKVVPVIIIEEKTKDSPIDPGQKFIYHFLDNVIRRGLEHELFKGGKYWFGKDKNGNEIYKKFKFLGTHSLKFEGTSFADGRVWFDGNEIVEEELKTILDLNNY